MKKICILLLFLLSAIEALYGAVDLIIFSKDRPMQLYALLESLQLHVTGLGHVAVVCHAKDDRFVAGYQVVHEQFPAVEFVFQNRERPRNDFLPLVKQLVARATTREIMFAVDDIIVTNPIDLYRCVDVMRREEAYGFYLRLGKDITYCYSANKRSPSPACTSIDVDFLRWDLCKGQGEWGYAHSVDMTIYSRHLVEQFVKRSHATSPNTFEGQWSGIPLPQHAQGVCYTWSRIINIPCNLVQQDWTNRSSCEYTVEQLLELFMQEYRIDVQKFRGVAHNAPHAEIAYTFKRIASN